MLFRVPAGGKPARRAAAPWRRAAACGRRPCGPDPRPLHKSLFFTKNHRRNLYKLYYPQGFFSISNGLSSPAQGRYPLCESISLHPAKNPHFAFFRQLSPLSRPILFIKIGATSYTNCIDHFCSATYIYSFCHTNLRQRLLPANPANEKLRYFLCISANRQSRSNSHSSQNHH